EVGLGRLGGRIHGPEVGWNGDERRLGGRRRKPDRLARSVPIWRDPHQVMAGAAPKWVHGEGASRRATGEEHRPPARGDDDRPTSDLRFLSGAAMGSLRAGTTTGKNQMKTQLQYVCPRCDHLLVPVHTVEGTKRRVIALTCPEPYCDHVQC